MMHESHGRTGLAFPLTLFLMQAFILIIWVLYGSYAPDADGTTSDKYPSNYTPTTLYQSWLGVHAMMLFGFGNLMTFLHRHGYSASGYTFLMTCLGIQWCIIMYSLMHSLIGGGGWGGPTLDVTMLFQGDFGVAAVLISFGALIGKVSPTQLLVLCFLEIIFYAASEAVISEVLKAEDAGGSIVIHTFGAYFGLVCSYIVTSPTMVLDGNDRENRASYTSDMFAMIGTLFLFLYWPSFNGGLLDTTTNQQERALVNTVLSLAGSCLATFLFSKCLRGHFSMVDVQNATLAGGVAIGSTCNMNLGPGGALSVGLLSGALSTVGFAKLQPFLADNFNLQDTCGIHNLHGMPGVFGGLVGVLCALFIPPSAYGGDIHAIYEARANALPGAGNAGRGAAVQSIYQVLAIITALAFAVVGGALTGYVLKAVPHSVPPGEFFMDDADWEVPSLQPSLGRFFSQRYTKEGGGGGKQGGGGGGKNVAFGKKNYNGGSLHAKYESIGEGGGGLV